MSLDKLPKDPLERILQLPNKSDLIALAIAYKIIIEQCLLQIISFYKDVRILILNLRRITKLPEWFGDMST